MRQEKTGTFNARQEVNLKAFLKKMFKYKWLFLVSICTFVALALLYIAITVPRYEVSTSILIDSSGSNRALGDSKYVEGGVGLIEVEKNLYNEVGIIKSFSLIRQTVEDLDFDVSYFSNGLIRDEERYDFIPFKVNLKRDKPQIYEVPFEIVLLNDDRYRLTIDTDEFTVSNPTNGSVRLVERAFAFSEEFDFGEEVVHEYFTFELEKPAYVVNMDDFGGDGFSFVAHNLDDVAAHYVEELDVNNIDIQASILKIVSAGSKVGKEKDFLTKLTDNYIQEKLTSRNKIASTKEDFIRNQLSIISDSLAKVESSMESFKKNEQAINLGATATNALNQTQDLQVEGAKIRLDIKYYNTLIQDVIDNRDNDDFVIPSATGINDPLLNQNIIELQRLYAEKSKKKFFVTSESEVMSILDDQIKESTDLLLNNLRNAVQSSRFALQRVNSQMANFNTQINTLPTQENQLLTIERKSNLYADLFNYLNQELAKTGIARAESTSDTRVLDAARMVGNGPVSPQKKLLMVLAITLGLLLPMGWIAIFSPKDIIEDVEQIQERSDIPILSAIVQHDAKDSDISLWKLKESFRDLSTKLSLLGTKVPCVLGITSIMPGEGKTYTSINLGITLAEAGKKVLIIDTDMRKPGLVKGFHAVKGKGLTEYLQGDILSPNDIIRAHEEVGNLEFLPTSVAKGNVHELLSGPKLKQLVESLKGTYDYIIMDTPAVGLVSDFLTLSDFIDVNLFVVRRNIARMKFLQDLEEIASHGTEKKSFIVFNGALKENHKYGYGHKYGLNQEKQLVNDTLSI
ncbi:polysaccharide biosynthesis tyrosine autokinase [Aggregatimonas sangjinii]|uniref:non-specific protein-tyrosine kinase n=1 Tax=Aggregatimonas sangjinii TaxID=2583587 RepID=A0A5B7SY32_9FLAO|nr:polysaccharide biosynthesis tyrosine autokinase [Aggregatimonas sangjinii]QCX01664.1 polysaccharide biosynthesis tyrosine autokinase [Aggregatimonas sangjinii]